MIHQNSPWHVLLCFCNNSRKCHLCVIAFNIATNWRESRYCIDWGSLVAGSNPKRKAMKLNDEGRGFTWECCICTSEGFPCHVTSAVWSQCQIRRQDTPRGMCKLSSTCQKCWKLLGGKSKQMNRVSDKSLSYSESETMPFWWWFPKMKPLLKGRII